jgi:hypothetical protein
MKKNLPTYELKINLDEDSIVSGIALVESPAIESNFLAFSSDITYEQFATNDERMELLGAALIPDLPIYRKNPAGEEYQVFFSKETVREIAQQYFKYGFQKNLNIGHTSIPAQSYIFQSYIVDSKKGLEAPKGVSAPDGSWIIGVKVDDKTTWNKIKAGQLKGFSIEGVFQMLDTKLSNEKDEDAELIQLLNQFNTLIKKYNKTNK